ncbi:NAD(P)-dependent oxidoreductase [Streptomyces hoynatensis]|uniref:NAD(P)-dependent oxidoreductase n=1 Tax=Streptomyces hoynatensis TaxID=1141874 RepID=A0A3A9ZC28_9ACTN|nr:NAD(P)-dependent oxidoreductase [Streptomyces hoynatensis]RKN45793.1 NAD(P)-dependent oxidoreductase [Streptomyces hoynatensis]
MTDTDRISVGVLGTGIMGAAMARNLSRAGFDVRVWNRTHAKAEPLAADGARVAASPAEAVEGAAIVLTMLYDGPAALSAMRAAAPGLAPGAVWMQSTTAGLSGLEPLADFAGEHRLTFMDVPVLGSRQPAEAGKLITLVAGPAAGRRALEPVLNAVGARTIVAGERAGDATRLKLVCNSWVLALTHATAEALSLAKGLGVEPGQFLEAVAGGPLDCGYLRQKADAILGGDLSAHFTVATAAKDTGLIVAAADSVAVRLDLATAGAARFRRATEQGHAAQDMAASYYASFDGGRAAD